MGYDDAQFKPFEAWIVPVNDAIADGWANLKGSHLR